MFEFQSQYENIIGKIIDLKMILYYEGDEIEIPYYWYDIILKSESKSIGKISIRLGHNYHSYYNGNIGYEIDEAYRGNGYSLIASKMVILIAKEYNMQYLMLTCDDDNISSYKIIEKLGAILQEKIIPSINYFGYYEGITLQRIYKLDL